MLFGLWHARQFGWQRFSFWPNGCPVLIGFRIASLVLSFHLIFLFLKYSDFYSSINYKNFGTSTYINEDVGHVWLIHSLGQKVWRSHFNSSDHPLFWTAHFRSSCLCLSKWLAYMCDIVFPITSPFSLVMGYSLQFSVLYILWQTKINIFYSLMFSGCLFSRLPLRMC